MQNCGIGPFKNGSKNKVGRQRGTRKKNNVIFHIKKKRDVSFSIWHIIQKTSGVCHTIFFNTIFFKYEPLPYFNK